MSTNALLAWRNWCGEYGTIEPFSGDWETQAPLSNLLTPRTGELAIATSTGTRSFIVTISDGSPIPGRPVRMIVLLNHNIIEWAISGVRLTLIDADGEGDNFDVTPGIIPSGDFQSHLFFLVPESTTIDLDRIHQVWPQIGSSTVCGVRDPYTGEIEVQPLMLGGVWAGPIWHPERGLKFATPQFGVIEQPRGVRSIGGQFFPQPQPRQRTLSAELTLLEESEAFTELQDLAAWSAVSRPVIAIPDISDAELAYRQGIYGYFDNPLTWQHFDATRDNSTAKREYRGSFSITEAL